MILNLVNMSERIFTAKIQTLHRIAIPKVVMESLNLKQSDIVEVKIRKIEG
jgi:bifunctional DNA-binding transcriptional regulator/antitoxin component of YhaV-PrlF toxin-antitoxin module